MIRDVLIGIDPVLLDHALQGWNETYSQDDKTHAIDGKTMRGAMDNNGKNLMS